MEDVDLLQRLEDELVKAERAVERAAHEAAEQAAHEFVAAWERHASAAAPVLRAAGSSTARALMRGEVKHSLRKADRERTERHASLERDAPR